MTTTIIPIIVNNDSRPRSYKQRFRTIGGDEFTVEAHTRDENVASNLFTNLATTHELTAVDQPSDDTIGFVAAPFVAAAISAFLVFILWVIVTMGDIGRVGFIVNPMNSLLEWLQLYYSELLARLWLIGTVGFTLWLWWELFWETRSKKESP